MRTVERGEVARYLLSEIGVSKAERKPRSARCAAGFATIVIPGLFSQLHLTEDNARMSPTESTSEDRLCLITGGTAGIGLCAAKMLARRGARLVLVGRDPQRGRAAVAAVEAAGGKAAFFAVDLSDQAAVRGFVASFAAAHPRLDILVNNAGGMFGRRRLSADGIEMTLALNHLGYFLLTLLLLPRLRSTDRPRIVNVASDAHFGAKLAFDDLQNARRYLGWTAYKRSKLCNLYFTYELSRRLAGSGITVNALHPGFVKTEIGTRNTFAIPLLWQFLTLFAVTPERGAETLVYLAQSEEVAEVSGMYFADSRAKSSSPVSYDLEAARRLWEASVALTGLDAALCP